MHAQAEIIDSVRAVGIFDLPPRGHFPSSLLEPPSDLSRRALLAPFWFHVACILVSCWPPFGPRLSPMVSINRRIQKPDMRKAKPGTRNPKPEIRSLKPEARNPKPKSRSQKPESQSHGTSLWAMSRETGSNQTIPDKGSGGRRPPPPGPQGQES